MNRISTLLSPLCLLGLFKLAFGTFIPPGIFDSAVRPGYAAEPLRDAPSLRSKMIKWVLDTYGVRDATETQLAMITMAVLIYSAVFGYLSDNAIRERGFGPSFNGIICFIGACFGLVGCVRVGLAFTPDQFALVVVVVVLASTTLLLAMATVKNWILAAIDRFMTGGKVVQTRNFLKPRVNAVAAERLASIGRKGRL